MTATAAEHRDEPDGPAFRRVAEALRLVADRGALGKVVVEMSSTEGGVA